MTKQMNNKIVVIALICLGCSVADWATVGQPYSFVCTVSSDKLVSFSWQDSKNDFNTLFYCEPREKTCTPVVKELLDVYNATLTNNATHYLSVFTIKHVLQEQHGSTWSCLVDSGFSTAYKSLFILYVITPPETPSCLKATLVEDINIQLECVTEKVFPESICVFYIKTNNTDAMESKMGSISYRSFSSTTAGYNETECIYTISAGILGPGSHLFYVVMYPNVTSIITEDLRKSSHYSNTVKMGYPIPGLALDCQANDYIRENQNRTCTCYDTSPTFLPSLVTWNTGAGQEGRLVFLSKRPSAGDINYTCSIANKLNWTNEIKYQPKISYGPNSVILTLQNWTVDLCDNNGANISGTCTVSDSNPDPTVHIYVSNTLLASQLKITKMDYRFSQVISESGIVYVLCRAVNIIFGDISSEIVNSVAVKGPPSTPQISSVTSQARTTSINGNLLDVSEGSTNITCESKGGFPLFKSLTLVCGKNSKANENSDTISMTLNISRDMQGMSCTCSVGHESKCGQHLVTVSLNLIKEEQNNLGAIIGGIIAACVGVFLIVAITVFIVRRHSKKQLQETNSNNKQSSVDNLAHPSNTPRHSNHQSDDNLAHPSNTPRHSNHQSDDNLTHTYNTPRHSNHQSDDNLAHPSNTPRHSNHQSDDNLAHPSNTPRHSNHQSDDNLAHPSNTPRHSTRDDVDKPTDVRKSQIKSTISDCFMGGLTECDETKQEYQNTVINSQNRMDEETYEEMNGVSQGT